MQNLIDKKKIFGIIIGLIVILCVGLSSMIFEDVDTKQIVVNQVPISGNIQVWAEPGLKIQLFGNLTKYNKAKQYWFSNLETEGGTDNSAIAIKYNDGSTGSVSGSVLIRMPHSSDKMTIINNECGSMQGVMDNIVTPNINKVIFASGALMSPFEAYAEKRNDLIYYIDDQLKYGVYKTVVKEVIQKDSINGNKTIKLATRVSNPDAPGGYERQESSPFAYYGISLSQLSISDFDFSPEVKTQIAQQQISQMSIETAIIESKAAQQRAIKAEAEGRADAETAKWTQEKIKIVEVTKAQQELEVAKTTAEKAFIVAELEAKQAREVAKKIIEEGRAQAEANRLKVQAGLTPQEAAEWKYRTTVGVAEAISKSPQKWVPEIMIQGGDSKGGVNAMDAVGLNMLMEVSNKMSK